MVFKLTRVMVAQTFREYSQHFGRGVFRRRLGQPYMRQRELAVIADLLKNLQPEHILEWGSGFSCRYMPHALNGNSYHWLTVEYEKEWCDALMAQKTDPNMEVAHIPPDAETWRHDHETYAAFKSYLEYPRDYGPYDLIFIDGRARLEAVKLAADMVSDTGIVVLHDANRPWYYQQTFGQYPYQQWLLDYRTEDGGFWFGCKTRPIDEVLNVTYYQGLWRLYKRYGPLLSLRLFRY